MKFIKSLLILSLLSFAGVIFYYTVPRDVNIELMPPMFKVCGKTVTYDDAKYIEIKKLLTENKNGWTIDWNTPIAGLYYSSPSYSIVVYSTGVHVGYKTDNGYTRLIKSIEHNLKRSCENAS